MFWCLAFWSLAPINVYALAPPPINFKEEIVRTEEGTFIVAWDGNKLTMNKVSDERGDSNDQEPTPPDPEPPNLFAFGCLILAALLFWIWLIGYWLYRAGIIIDVLIVSLVLFLIGHIWWTFKRRGK